MIEEKPGYIPIFRKFFNHYLWEESREFSKAEAWIDCIQMARYTESKKKKLMGGNLIEWGYGQFPASVRFLKERWGWGSNTKVENFLSLLESDDMIKIEKGQGQNVITLCNYSSYDIKNLEGKDSERTDQGQSKDRPRTDQGQNSKKGKKVKKDKNYIPTIFEVKEYFKQNGYDPEVAEKAFNMYNASIEDHPQRKYWRDSRDNPIKNWKLKMQGVWFKEENKLNGHDDFNPENAKRLQNSFR